MHLALDRKSPAEWEYINEAAVVFWGLDVLQQAEKYYSCQEKLVATLDLTFDEIACCTGKKDFNKLISRIIDFWGISNIKTAYPAYCQGDYFNTIIDKFVDFLWYEFVHTEGNWKITIENFLGLHSIPIMTIHKSKGLEYTAVYFIGLEDGAFWNFKNQPEEDRCAFFVALSRAKQYLAFAFCNTRHKLRYPQQKHIDINEFFELLKTPGIAEVIKTSCV